MHIGCSMVVWQLGLSLHDKKFHSFSVYGHNLPHLAKTSANILSLISPELSKTEMEEQ